MGDHLDLARDSEDVDCHVGGADFGHSGNIYCHTNDGGNSDLMACYSNQVDDSSSMDSSGIDADKEPVEPCPLDCPLRSYALEPNRKLPADIRLRQLPLPPQAALAARIYTPIRDWQTRLLCLQPGRFGDPIIADLSVVDLIYFEGVVARETEEVLAYEALSYCWGEPQYEYPIRLNGHLYSVTRNLYAALQHLRFEDRRRWLWIDACCINQYDNAEKSSQILNMLAIFEKAETVIVWLGEPAEGSCLAFGYIPHYALGRATEHARWHCNKGGVRLYRGLRYVYSRPWLRRVWIRQEIFAARVVTVRCGDQAIDWEQFESGDKWLSSWIAWPDTVQDLQPLGDEHRRALSGLRDVRFGARIVSPVNMSDNSNYSFTYDRAHDIVRVLRDAADCEASNPLDRVYGLLGMTSIGYPSRRRNKGSLPKLVVDYKKSPSRVFQDVAKYVMNRDHSINILYLRGTYGQNGGLDLPSWTPDWRHPTDDQPFDTNDPSKYDGWEPRIVPLRHQDSDHVGVLNLHGILLAKIASSIDEKSSEVACYHVPWNMSDEIGDLEIRPRCLSNEGTSCKPPQPWTAHYMSGKPIDNTLWKWVETSWCYTIPPIENRILKYESYSNSSLDDVSEFLRSKFWNLPWMVPRAAVEDDCIVIAEGGAVPVILRPSTPDSYTYIGAAIPCFDLTVPVDAEDPKYDYDDGMHEVRSEKEEAKTSRELTTELSSSLSSCMHDVLRQEKESLDVFRVV